MLAPVAVDDRFGSPTLARGKGWIDGDHAAAGRKRSGRAGEQPSHAVVVDVMQDAEDDHEVEAAEIGGNLRGVADAEACTAVEALAGPLDVLRAQVDARVLDVA